MRMAAGTGAIYVRAESRAEDRREGQRYDCQLSHCTVSLAISLYGQSLSININKVSGDFKDMRLMLNHQVLFD